MELFGYKKRKNKCLSLSETTIMCTYKELDKLIDFFLYCKEKFSDLEDINIEEVKKDPVLGYLHYRDWDKEKLCACDLIVSVSVDTKNI